MVYVLFGFAVAVLVLAIPCTSRRLRNSRVARPAGGPSARPAAQPAGRAAVPVITDMPEHEDRQPFAYGGIVAIEPHDEEDGS